MSNDFEHDDEEIIFVSKSQLKRESHALQELGEALVELPASKLAQIPMPEELADAVALARKITARGGRKRQLQYIGKVMRQIDPEPIERAMEGLKADSARETARLHKLEQWRER
ncbi:MAG TPA: ribosome biogenesis factor YjgA, partial [Gammaproteobacteria bacterium]